MERLEKFFIMIVLTVTMIMLSVIAWGMLKPVLITNRDTAAIVKAIKFEDAINNRQETDIQMLKGLLQPKKEQVQEGKK